MANWTYRCYDDGKEPNLWQRWYESRPLVQGAHDNAFETLESEPIWKGGHIRKLVNANGVHEVKFKGNDKREWRVFGFFDNRIRQQFIVVEIGYHKKQNYTPRGVIKKAINRKKEIENGDAEAIRCERPA